MTQEQREAEEQILSEAFDLVHEIAIGSGKDWENAYKILAVRREAKLRAYERAVEEMEKMKYAPTHDNYGLRLALSTIRKHLEAIQ